MIKAIDVHVHVPIEPSGPGKEVEKLVSKYEKLDIFGIVLGRDSRTISGKVDVTNDYIASIVKKYPDRFLGVGSVDPWLGKEAIYEAERAIKELGLKGFKFEPYRQEFYINDKGFYPLWEKIQALGVPIMVHSGTIQDQEHSTLNTISLFLALMT